MASAFDDGTPLDAAKLQDLQTRLVELEAKSLTDNSGLNTGNSTLGPYKVVGSKVSNVALIPGVSVPFNIEWDLPSKPVSVVLTPAKQSGISNLLSYAVDAQSFSGSGCRAHVFLEKIGPKNRSMNFFWIAVYQ